MDQPYPSVSLAIRPLEKIREALSSIHDAQAVVQPFAAGEILLREGETGKKVSLILKGEIELLKCGDEGEEYSVGMLRPGQFLGLLALSSGLPSFFTARARVAGAMLRMPRDRFAHLLHTRSDFNQLVTPLLLGNLVDRYRRVVRLHMEVAHLTRELNIEKLQLSLTIDMLQATRNRLIQQEKMATLGQLVAGIAHEINNPISSLTRCSDALELLVSSLFAEPVEPRLVPYFQSALRQGLARKPLQTEPQRRRSGELQERFPELPRSLVRSLAQLEPDAFEELRGFVWAQPAGERVALLHRLMEVFETGVLVRNLRTASGRISSIVRSLKSYSRQDRAEEDSVDLREGLQDTLVLFGYALKKFEVFLELPDLPPVRCRPSELNQVWTNLVLNACEAMGDDGKLRISCAAAPAGWVTVSIQDSGPGVPDELREKIFENNFSTKPPSAAHSSGLGLGLAIAKSIVEKHGGRIEVANAAEGGAVFRVFLPVAASPGG